MIRARQKMIMNLAGRGISSGSVLEVMSRIQRHLFVSEALRYRAYDNISLPIGYGQTISKPSVIALMVQSLNLTGSERVLEIGTGSGYQSAILSQLCHSLVTMERIEDLLTRARSVLVKQGYTNIQFIHSGNLCEAPGLFDVVIVAAGAEILPVELFEKIDAGGRLVIPVSDGAGHSIKKFTRRADGTVFEESIGEATFVPLISGAAM